MWFKVGLFTDHQALALWSEGLVLLFWVTTQITLVDLVCCAFLFYCSGLTFGFDCTCIFPVLFFRELYFHAGQLLYDCTWEVVGRFDVVCHCLWGLEHLQEPVALGGGMVGERMCGLVHSVCLPWDVGIVLIKTGRIDLCYVWVVLVSQATVLIRLSAWQRLSSARFTSKSS